jgi:hypothetical protein
MTDRPILETVSFRLLPDTDPAAFDAADAAAQAFLEGWPGFLGRTLAVDADGRYLDLVRWAHRGAAVAAADAYLASAAGRSMSALIDPASIELRHLGITRGATGIAA